MIGGVGRAEALAAVALVVGARQEPVAALRRLAGEDPALAALARVADRLAAGSTLTDALRSCRLLPRRAGATLGGLPPERLAEELTRLAQRSASPPVGEILARWLPLWAIAGLAIPSLLIAAAVWAVTGSLYTGLMSLFEFDFYYYRVEPGMRVLLQLGGLGLAALIVLGDWLLLRVVPFVRRLTVFSTEHERAVLTGELLRALRSGDDGMRLIERWARRSGIAADVRRAVDAAGGDVAAALIALGVLPRDGDGRPDWDAALAEADAARARCAAALLPTLGAVLICVGVCGFISWGSHGVPDRLTLAWLIGSSPSADLLLGQCVWVIIYVIVAVVAAHLLLLGTAFVRSISGPARDWPLVADRIARALDRREDIGGTLRGLRFVVGPPMRRRIARALSSPQGSPGQWLARAGIVPAALAHVLSSAPPADLPGLLRAAGDRRDDHGLQVLIRQATVMAILLLLVTAMTSYMSVGIAPKYARMMLPLKEPTQIMVWVFAAWWAAIGSLGVLILVTILHAVGQRLGWWSALGGWRRRARGLVLRRLLAGGAREPELAQVMRQLSPRLPRTLDDAASRGDLAGVMSVSGWAAATPAALDRALVSDLVADDRRRARLAIAARLLMPLLLAVPIGLNAIAVWTTLTQVQTHSYALTIRGAALPTGGTMGTALMYWMTTRYEEQGEAVVEEIRARDQQWKTRPPRAHP